MRYRNSSIAIVMSCVLSSLFTACSNGAEFADTQSKPLAPNSNDSKGSKGSAKNILEKTFLVGGIYGETLTIKPEQRQISQSFQLHKNSVNTAHFAQTDRPIVTDTKSQGQTGTIVSQPFDAREAGLLDILIVMDNSGSMKPYQDQLAPKLETLLQNIHNTNWQIGFDTSDNPCMRDIITRQDYDLDPVATKLRFSKAISPGTTGSTIERGIEMAVTGLQGICKRTGNRPWLRPGAATAVMIVSDEENCGSGDNNCDAHAMPHYTAADFLTQAPPGARVYGLFQSYDVCGDDGYATIPQNYYDIVSQTHGIWSPICSPDFTPILQTISADISQITKADYVLSHTPDHGTVTISVGSTTLTTGFTVNGTTVTIPSNLIGDAASITINYTYASSARWDTMQLSQSVDAATLNVSMNDVPVLASSYTLQPDLATLVFSPAPSDLTNVVVKYRSNAPLSSAFTVPTSEQIYDVTASINGTNIDDVSIDSTTNTVTFASAPTDGSKIDISYRVAADIQTVYSTLKGDSPSNQFLSLVDESTNAPITCTYDDGNLTLPISEIADGRAVKAIFASSIMDSDLPHAPIKGTLGFDSQKDASECVKKAMAESDQTKLTIDCPGEVPPEIEVTYQYSIPVTNAFDMDARINAQAPVAVWVNKKRIYDYKLDGSKVVLPDAYLQHGNEITVHAMPAQ